MTLRTTVTPDPTTDQPPRRRRWIPLTLRMFVAVLVLTGLVGGLWIGVPAYQRMVAIREIERLGGRVIANAIGPKWVRDLVGVDQMRVFDDVIFIGLDGTEATDATLHSIGWLTRVQHLQLGHTKVTDAGLRHLRAMTDLTHLYLAHTRVTDAGLANLCGLIAIEVLDLSETSITDAGLLHLESLTKLGTLNLKRTKTTHAGFSRLKRTLPELWIQARFPSKWTAPASQRIVDEVPAVGPQSPSYAAG